VRTKFADG